MLAFIGNLFNDIQTVAQKMGERGLTPPVQLRTYEQNQAYLASFPDPSRELTRQFMQEVMPNVDQQQ